MIQKLRQFLQSFKTICFQFLFVLHHNAITNKHMIVLIQLLQLISLIYFYFNPIYQSLHRFQIFKLFFQSFWTKLFLLIPSQSFLVSLILLLMFPSIIGCIILMKLIFGYQYIILVAIQLWLLFYPVLFVKFTIQSVNAVIGFPEYRVFGIFAVMVHTIGSVFVLHLYNKKYKLIDILPIILIYLKVNSYVVLAFVIIRLIISYFISPQTLIKPLRIHFQIALLLILIFSYFASDYLTNYISFIMILVFFTLSQLFYLVKNYDQNQTIFYHLQNLTQQESDSKLKYYQFIQNHRIECENVNCMCRELGNYTNDEQIKQKGYKFVQKLYEFKQDVNSRIQLGLISSEYYEYSLSGFLMLFQLKPTSLYQEYKLYFVKTKYQQQFRKLDKNYSFGQQYYNAYEQVRYFQQKIQQLTKIIKQFWQTILFFDGSKKFISMIIQISQKITQIKQKYEIYIQKYEDFNNQFRYLYKTFQIAILNLLDKDKMENNYSFGNTRKQINIKVPERQLFFISNIQTKIVNCNRQFCNLVEMNKANLLNSSYEIFIPEICSQEHNKWVSEWYQNYNRDEQQNLTIKPFSLKSNYIKCVKISNRILPRFDVGIQIISLLKVISKLQNNTLYKSISSQIGQQNMAQNQNECETFFSFLIEKNTMKILYIDDSFFYTTMIDQNDEIKDKILNLRINQLFPKVVISGLTQSTKVSNDNIKEAMLNYSALEDILGSRDKKNTGFNATGTMRGNTIYNNKNKSNQQHADDQPFSFSRKSKRKLTNASGISLGGTPHIKDNVQQIFLYEVIEQKNIGLQTQYCIINFQLKKNVASQTQSSLTKTKQKLKTKIILNQQSAQKKLRNSRIQQQKEGQKQIMYIIQKGKQKEKEYANNLNINLAFREPFIRSSKPYKQQVNQEQQMNKKKAKIRQNDQFSKGSKSYCLAWPIIVPLFIVHIFYLQVHDSYENILFYLKNSFDFYDKYELQSLRQLDIYFSNATYISDLKSLWISGFGFYHSSLLTFQNPNDLFFVDKLANQIIPQNLYGVYQQIQLSYQNQISGNLLYYYIIVSIFILFILYAAVDFAFNILYCFKISSRVTDIVSIFLNIPEKDIKKLIYSIQKYQDQVLEITDFNELEVMRKRQKQDYGLEQYENGGLTELSGIGLLRQDKYSFITGSNIKNMDSLQTSPNKEKQQNDLPNDKNAMNIFQPIVIPKSPNSRRSSSNLQLHRRRSSLAEKMQISKLKQSMSFLKQGSQDQIKEGSQHSFLQSPSKSYTHTKKSSFSNNISSFNESNVSNQQQKRNLNMKDQVIQTVEDQQQDQQKALQQQEKLQKIKKFKQKYRGNINDIKQNPKPYIFLLIVILITIIILIVGLIIIPKYINNLEKFSNVYFNLRKLKIIMLNEFIKKKSSIQLLPNIKSSVYSLNFYNIVQNDLTQLPDFRYFWNKVYTDNTCSIVEDQEAMSLCLSLDKSMTAYGQKVMFQYLEDYLRRKTPDNLFANSLTNPTKFMNVSKLLMNLISLGQIHMANQIHKYKDKAKNYELMIAIIGTILLVLSIFMSHKGLSNIRSKINDGQNLLLIVPETIKTNVVRNMSLNKLKEQLNIQQKQKGKKKKKRKNSKRNENSNNNKSPSHQSPSSPAQTGSQLIANKSSLLNNDEDEVLKSALKAPQKKSSFLGKK